MIKNLIRTCDMCHREIPPGKYMQRNSDRNSPDILMVLAENEDRDLQLIELPDGSIAMDTCMNCYSRMGFSFSLAVN
jgi:hypothetical protein